MESAKKAVTFRNISLPRGVELGDISQHVKVLRIGLFGLNACGLFILFLSLCVLSSKVPAVSTGFLWWILVFHFGISAAWGLGTFAPERCSRHLESLQLFKLISAVLLMLLCDRASQFSHIGFRVCSSSCIPAVYPSPSTWQRLAADRCITCAERSEQRSRWHTCRRHHLSSCVLATPRG